MRERLEEIARKLIRLSLVNNYLTETQFTEEQLAELARTLLDNEANQIEKDFLGYGE